MPECAEIGAAGTGDDARGPLCRASEQGIGKLVDDWGTGTGDGGEPPWRPRDAAAGPGQPPLPGWMRRAPSGDHGARGTTVRERARHLADRARRRPPLNAPVYAYGPEPEKSFWGAGKGVLLGSAFAAGSLAIALTLVALVRIDPHDTVTDPDDGIEIAGDPTTSLPGTNFDRGKVPLEAPSSSTTTAPPTTEEPTTVPVTDPPTTAAPTTAPPTTAPPTTAAPTTTRQPAPQITSFAVEPVFGWCRDRDETRVRFSWTTTNATDAQFGPQGRDSDAVGTNGSENTCAQRQSTWVLSVSGPGGTDNATVTAPS